MSDEKKPRMPIQRHGNTFVINKKLCLYTLGVLLLMIGLGLFFFTPTIANLRMSLKGIGIIIAASFACFVLASFTSD